LKKLFWILLRWALPVAIITYLVVQGVKNDSFAKLRDHPKQWDLLALAAGICFLATIMTIVRWHFLVRAVDLPLRLRDTLRLGFLGYMYNFVLPGGVGGDLVKAGFLAREQPGRRTEAVLTVLVDRIVGLYGLFLLATLAIFMTGMWHDESGDVRFACRVMFWCAGVSTVLLAITAMPGFSKGPISRRLHELPRVGGFIERVNRATRMYYRHWSVLPIAVVFTMVTQSFYAIGFWLLGRGLLDLNSVPTLGQHMVIVPMAMITGVLPLAPNGLGTFEALVEFMYRQLMGSAAIGDGFIVSLGYRFVTVLIAIVGAVIYFFNRNEISAVIHEEEAAEAAEKQAAAP
jgi:glycosyltransferase 2 family protein